MTDPRQYYLDHVYPLVADDVKQAALLRYDLVRLGPAAGFLPLPTCEVIMLVGLTGTGKSTTLAALAEADMPPYTTRVPSRRELADLILIPAAQHHAGEPTAPVTDRARRFAYTRMFREQVAPGGTATAFSWLHLHQGAGLVVSEGVRGANEIQYALEHTRWRVVELWVEPLTRLRRLSNRADAFDVVANPDAADLSFLPAPDQPAARAAIAAGEISPAAVTTVRAEARNYGAHPYDPANNTPNYHYLPIDDLTPQQAAAAVAQVMS